MSDLPNGWASASVGDIATQIRGVTYRKGDASSVAGLETIPLLRAGNITASGLDFQDLIHVPKALVKAKQVTLPGDVLIASSSGSLDVVGKAAEVSSAASPATFGAFCKVLRPSDAIDHRYFAHFFQTPDYRLRIQALAAGANINNLKSEHLDELQMPLPPLPEQRRIAAILDKAVEVEGKTATALSSAQRFTGALFQKQFADAPADHAVLADVLAAKLANGRSPASEGSHHGKVLTLSAVTSGRYLPERQKDAAFDKAPSAGQYVSDDHFLISRGNGNIDLVGVGVVASPGQDDVVFPDTVIGAPLNREAVEPEFLEAAWASPFVRSQIRASARTTNGTFKVNQASLSQIEIPLPPLKTQREFTQQIQGARRTEAALMHRQRDLTHLIGSLQSRAFRGEL